MAFTVQIQRRVVQDVVITVHDDSESEEGDAIRQAEAEWSAKDEEKASMSSESVDPCHEVDEQEWKEKEETVEEEWKECEKGEEWEEWEEGAEEEEEEGCTEGEWNKASANAESTDEGDYDLEKEHATLATRANALIQELTRMPAKKKEERGGEDGERIPGVGGGEAERVPVGQQGQRRSPARLGDDG